MLAMYGMVFLVPGDPASVALGPRATPALKAMLTERMGLDQPIAVQIWRFFANAAQGDLGMTCGRNARCLTKSSKPFPQTLLLGAVALSWALIFGITLGVPGRRLSRHLDRPRARPRVGQLHLGAVLCRRDLPAADLRGLAGWLPAIGAGKRAISRHKSRP